MDAQHPTFSKMMKFLNLIKKPADIIDDTWNAMRKLLPEAIIGVVGPFLIGSLFFVINFLEGINAAQEFREAYENELIGQRKTRILASLFSFMLAGTGFGLSTAMLIGAFSQLGMISASISGMAVFPFVIPAALLCMYSISLYKHSYVLFRSNQIEEQAKNAYENYIYEKCITGKNFSQAEADRLYDHYKNTHETRLEAEREVALSTLEVVGSALICTGILLGTAALIGASAASFGALPLALLIAGVTIGFASKLLEWRDNKHHFDYTRRMRNFFRRQFDLPNDEPQLIHEHGLEPPCNPELSAFVPSPDSAMQAELKEPHYTYRIWKTSKPIEDIELKPISQVDNRSLVR